MKKLFFIETEDYSNVELSGACEEDTKLLTAKYGRNEPQVAEIETALINQFYTAPVSFYFYLDEDLANVADNDNPEKYVLIDGAYFSTVDRGCGSNWLGERAIFKIAVPHGEFVKSVRPDIDGGGYSWNEIAGQVDFENATLRVSNIVPKDYQLVSSEISSEMEIESFYAKNWESTGNCMPGDMRMSRHKDTPYINEFPCGNKCSDCGTFWID